MKKPRKIFQGVAFVALCRHGWVIDTYKRNLIELECTEIGCKDKIFKVAVLEVPESVKK